MKRLILLRHAKAVGKETAEDFDRVLAPAGRAQMTVMSRYLADERLAPDLAIVSPAARTRETWSLAKIPLAEDVAVAFDERIYDASDETLLVVLRETAAEVRSVVLVGHNPGIEDLARRLVGYGDRYAAARMMESFPTGALAVVDLAVDTWREIEIRSGRLDRFVTPASLGFK